MSELAAVIERLEADFEAAVERWADLLRIPSVSTDPAYEAHMRRAGQWLVDDLRGLGFEAGLRQTAGHPAVVAHHPGPGGDAPHVLYYGHYDVQPPDPEELWDSGPFEPTLVAGPHGRRMVARGAVDDKGQLMTFVEAFRAWRAVHGTLPVRATVLIEGEEEVGSANLGPFLRENAGELGADVCVISDTGAWDVDTPALTTMLRGLLTAEVRMHGPDHDLHSGLYGGAVANPLNALAGMLGRLHDDDGRVRIPGFYDAVAEIGDDERRRWQALEAEVAASFRDSAGVGELSGEAGRSLLERLWSRPTADVNGLVGGYTGAGTKTVIAAHGTAKLSFRLVPEQDPEAVAAGLRAFVEAETPAGCRAEVEVHTGVPAVRVATESPYLQAARRALAEVYGREPVLMGCGGSIPVVGMVRETLGLETVLMGFGLQDDRMHSPNEKFELVCFERGAKSHAALLARLRELGAAREAAE